MRCAVHFRSTSIFLSLDPFWAMWVGLPLLLLLLVLGCRCCCLRRCIYHVENLIFRAWLYLHWSPSSFSYNWNVCNFCISINKQYCDFDHVWSNRLRGTRKAIPISAKNLANPGTNRRFVGEINGPLLTECSVTCSGMFWYHHMKSVWIRKIWPSIFENQQKMSCNIWCEIFFTRETNIFSYKIFQFLPSIEIFYGNSSSVSESRRQISSISLRLRNGVVRKLFKTQNGSISVEMSKLRPESTNSTFPWSAKSIWWSSVTIRKKWSLLAHHMYRVFVKSKAVKHLSSSCNEN